MLSEGGEGGLDEAAGAVDAVAEVLEADAISGPQDLICRVVARDTEHLQEVVNELLRTPSIRRCTSYIVLSRQGPARPGALIAAAAAAGARGASREGERGGGPGG